MDQKQWLADRFEEHRPRLQALAYRMLGSLADADDAVQETWLRASRAGGGDIENLGGWFTTIVSRVCLNLLRSRNVRREQPLDAHVPDPVISREPALQPEEEALMADSVGLALLVVLETLSPAERLAFVLHDMFDLPFDEIAPRSSGRPRRPDNSPAELAGVSGASNPRGRTAISSVSARSSMPSFEPRVPVTLTASSPCSIPTWCCEPTLALGALPHRG